MSTIKSKALASLKMKKYALEAATREKREYAASFPRFREAEARYREAVRLAAIGSGGEELLNSHALRVAALAEIGLSEADVDDVYYCSACRDTGVIRGGNCKCLNEEISSILLTGGLNERHTFENSAHAQENDAVFEYCKEYPKGGVKDNILLIGKVGTGKTYLIHAIGNELLRREKNAVIYTAFDLNMLFLRIKLAEMGEKYSLWSDLLQTEYLLIDDLGTEDTHKATAASLFNLLNQRLESRKKTVITSNRHPLELKELYGERIFSRLTDKASTYMAMLAGKDLRHN